MTIEFVQGDLLDAPVEALVNAVNTVGIMGKGIALQFKHRFPQNMAAYSKACKSGLVNVGKMYVTETSLLVGPRWIINFPTKKHWRDNSQIEWIESGLQDLKSFIIRNAVKSIAIPALGAGNGGLDWRKQVKPIVVVALAELSEVDILVYEPLATG
jgi:O-acetyl-ADP-ribose deacetylase (regulator of RNase III)